MTTFIKASAVAIAAALAQAPAVCDDIERGKRRPVPPENSGAILVRPVQSEVTQRDNGGMPIAWMTSIAVEIYVRNGASVSPDDAADPLIEAVYARLQSGISLGAQVVVVMPKGIGWDFDVDGTDATCATLVFELMHRTAGVTLT